MEQSREKNSMIKKRRRVLLLVLLLLFTYWIYRGNRQIQITELQVRQENLPKEFSGFRIAQISDLHNQAFGPHQEKLLQALKNTKPDIIVITGDLIDAKTKDISPAMDLIRGAVKIAPVYYVPGNHEAWTPVYRELKEELQKSKVKILEDEKELLKRGEASLLMIGLQDPEFFSLDSVEEEGMFRAKLKELMKDETSFSLLLSHRPEQFKAYVDSEVDLVFSGHAHGGQFRIPFIGGLIAPNQGFFPKYTEGLYQEKNTSMVVSRGLGNSIIPVRINNPPEIVVVILGSMKEDDEGKF